MNNITIEYLFRLLLRRFWIIALVAVLCGTAAFSYCNWFADEVYSAKAKIIIGNGAFDFSTEEDEEEGDPSSSLSSLSPYYYTSSQKISGSDIQSSMYLANTCIELLRSNTIYQDLAEALVDDRNQYGKYKGCISVSLTEEDSIFVNISANSVSPDEAVEIVNTFAALTPQYLKEYMRLADVDVIDIADGASQTAPRTVSTTVIFAVAGALIVYVLSLIIDMNDKTIKGEMDFTETYNIPLLGSVPNFEDATTAKGGYYGNGNK